MIEQLVTVLISLNAIAAAVDTFYAACAVNAMGRETRTLIRWTFIITALAHFAQVLAGIDYVFGQALAWPWLFLFGVAVSNGGAAMVYLISRRQCTCAACPMRRRVS